MSVEETMLNLLDTFWFKQTVFTTSKPALSASFLQEKEEGEETAADDDSVKLTTTSPMRKSYSDQFLRSSEPGSPSPKSVLGPHLQTILSGKEVQSFDGSLPEEEEKNQIDHGTADAKGVRARVAQRGRDRRRGRRWKSGSRSLSELEFEEVKGFMDLGFVFLDEDRDSRLVSIIPGLQRLGKDVEEMDGVVSRPYLSEAWDSEGERGKNPLMEWRIPSFGNEMELKDHLKCWAHTVASTVR